MDNTKFDIERYRVDFNELSLKWTIENMIGREKQIGIIKGCIPLHSDKDDRRLKFTLYPQSAYHKKEDEGSVLIFIGHPGSGKSTLDDAWGYHICLNYGDDDELKKYNIPLAKLIKNENKENIISAIESIFSSILELEALYEEDETVMLSFGDITSLLKKKKLKVITEKYFEKLKSSDKCLFFITAYFNDDNESLPVSFQKKFINIRFNDPDASEREEYYKLINDFNEEVILSLTNKELAELTAGFSFLMLGQTINLIYSFALGQIIEEENAAEIMEMRDPNKPIIIPAKTIKEIIQMVKDISSPCKEEKQLYKSVIMSQSLPLANTSFNDTKINESNNENANYEPKRKIEDDLEKIDRIEELKNYCKQIPPHYSIAVHEKYITQAKTEQNNLSPQIQNNH